MNFNYVSFESILIILHEINMIIVTHPTTFVHCFGVLFSGTRCRRRFKTTLRLSSLFLAQTRIRYHLGCLNSFRNAFRNAFLELSRLSSISQYREYEECQECFHCGAALRNFIRNTMHLNAFENSFALSPLQKRVSGSNAFQIALFFRV